MHIHEKNNFIYLTTALILLLFAASLVDQFLDQQGQRMIQAATVLVLITGVWTVKSTRLWFKSGLGFVFLAILISIIGIFFDRAELSYTYLFIMLCFFVWTALLALKQVLFSGVIDQNKIIGSICIYLLIGLTWTFLYLLVAEVFPNAFNGIDQAVWYYNFHDMAYYSFVTLTTLGYGDITPAIPIARFLVYMEAVFGMFYMTVLVASLVGAKLSARNKNT